MTKKKIIKDYFKTKLFEWLMLFLILLFFVIILLIYNVNSEPIIYGSCVTVFLLAVFYFVEFILYYRKVTTLNNFEPLVNDKIELNCSYGIEEIWFKKITQMKAEVNSLITSADQKQTETEDYYVLWAHQIKTPIAGLKLLIENDKNINYKRELFRIESYVEMVMNYARLDSMEHDFCFTKVDIDNLVKEVAKKYSLEFILSKIALNISKTSLFITTDEKWLAFSVEQIISNSLKYTKNGKIDVYSEGNKLIIEDSGIGICQEDLPRITERGFTGFNGRFDKKSSGLGLYLVSKILAKLNIIINISSKVGVGTKVEFDFSNLTKK